MSIKKLGYTGSNKVIKNIISAINDLIDGGGGGGSSVSFSPTLTSGTKTGEITINNVVTNMYAPTPPDELTDLTDIAVSSPANNDVLKYNSTSHKWENGQGGSGVSNVFGAFIDTSHIVKATTAFLDHTSYTATEDCFVRLYVVIGRGSVFCTVDGENVWNPYGDNVMGQSTIIPLRKGQVLEITNAHQTYESSYIVYGVIGGTNPIFAPMIYSDTEREIGTWRNGKPLYQKTVVITSISTDTNWHQTAHGITNIDEVVLVKGVITNTTGYSYSCSSYRANTTKGVTIEVGATYVDYINNWLESPNKLYVTLQYTKTTDTPGSGKWNVDGVPAVHYSTSERVIGTWIDGKPLYEKTISIANITLSANQVATVYTQSDIKLRYAHGYCVEADIVYLVPEMSLRIKQTGNNIQLAASNNSSWVITEGYLTIQYTKTTD